MGSIADLSNRYRSLTARKLLSGTAGSVTSIDTLVEVRQLLVIITWLEDEFQVNNVAAALGNLATSRSSDAVDFGVV